MRKPRLTPPLHALIISGIRSGGYPHVAAQTHGVPPPTFLEWLERGERPGARGRYAEFARDVREAAAHARLTAEMAVYHKRPLDWLEHGQGRERPGNPGWSTSVKAQEQDEAKRNALLDPEVLSLCQVLLEALTPYAEARQAAAAKLAALQMEVKP